jgi:hypothetical protein
VIIYQVGALFGNTYMREPTAKNVARGFRKAGLYPFNSSIFRPHEFLVAEKDSEQTSVEAPKNFNQVPPVIKVNINPVTAIDISPLPTFCEKRQRTIPCAGSAQVITSSPHKNLLEDANKKKKHVNKKVFQSRSQDET